MISLMLSSAAGFVKCGGWLWVVKCLWRGAVRYHQSPHPRAHRRDLSSASLSASSPTSHRPSTWEQSRRPRYNASPVFACHTTAPRPTEP